MKSGSKLMMSSRETRMLTPCNIVLSLALRRWNVAGAFRDPNGSRRNQ
jgi:hypothetical protein